MKLLKCQPSVRKLQVSGGWIALSCSAVLFDLDGVLIDSTPVVERIWLAWARKHRLESDYVVQNAHGRRTIDTVRIVAPHLDAVMESMMLESIAISELKGLLVLPGVRKLLRQLPQDRFTIVTSASRGLALARLQFVGLPIPTHFVSSDDVMLGKPDPQPYVNGAELLGVNASDVLVFEDSPAGIQAAKAAGMLVIALTSSAPLQELRFADAIVNSFEDLHVDFDGQVLTFALQLKSKGER